MSFLGYDLQSQKWCLITKKNEHLDFSIRLNFDNPAYNFFISQDSYFYIYNHLNNTIEYTSPNISKVIGVEPDCFTHWYFLSHLHNYYHHLYFIYETSSQNSLLINNIAAFKQLKYSYNLSFNKDDGTTIEIFHQALPFQLESRGRFQRSLIYHTVLHNLYQKDQLITEFIDLNNNFPEKINFHLSHQRTQTNLILTKNEIQIVYWLANGMTSRQIGFQLNLSELTVQTYRKKILKKTNCHSTSELIALAIKLNWL